MFTLTGPRAIYHVMETYSLNKNIHQAENKLNMTLKVNEFRRRRGKKKPDSPYLSRVVTMDTHDN